METPTVAALAEMFSILTSCPSLALLRSEDVANTAMVSVPAPPSTVSTPPSQMIVSSPTPPLIESAPRPPVNVSAELPPRRVKASICLAKLMVTPAVAPTAETASIFTSCASFASLSDEDVALKRRVSYPSPPSTVSLPTKPLIVSSPRPAMIVSAPKPPVSVSAKELPIRLKRSIWFERLTATPL